jgi:hypothetical protein
MLPTARRVKARRIHRGHTQSAEQHPVAEALTVAMAVGSLLQPHLFPLLLSALQYIGKEKNRHGEPTRWNHKRKRREYKVRI